jgi:hypothetical protein
MNGCPKIAEGANPAALPADSAATARMGTPIRMKMVCMASVSTTPHIPPM